MKSPSRRAWLAIGGGAAAVLVGVPVLLLAGVKAGLADGVVRGALSAKLGRPVTFSALKVKLAPGASRFTFSDFVLGEPRRFGRGELARVRTLDLTLKLLPLLAGRLDAPRITLVQPVLHLRRKGPGNDNWTFGKGGASSFLTATDRLVITDGRMDMDDPQRHLQLHGTVSHDAAGALPLHLDGGGVLNGAPFTVAARGGALNGRKPGAPHSIDVRLVDGDTHVRMVGASQKPFDFRGFEVDFAADGPNLADLVYLFNLLAPNSPRFTLTAHMRKAGSLFHATAVKAKVGDSDLAGEITADHAKPRRAITATLRSQRMTARDLAAMLASPPSHAVARSTPGVPGEGHAPSPRVLPQSPFSLARLQHNDIDLDYAARQVSGYGPPVGDARVRLKLTAGRLALSPLSFAAAGGRAHVVFAVDTDRATPLVTMKADVRGVQVASLAGRSGFSGRLDADLDAKGAGASFAAAAAAADGTAALRVTGGALPKTDAAALKGDLFGLVGAALGGGKGRAPLRCARADFTISDGVMRATRLSVGAGDGLATGGGTVDLKREAFDLALRATGRGAAPAVQLKAPITLTGPFAKPKVDAKLSRARFSLGGLFKSGNAAVAPPAC